MDENAALARAHELALRARRTSPNPRVGCVLLSPEGEVVGQGWHRGAGRPHAEIEALRDAGAKAAGATAVVTLEPCDHTGRTGPCTQALLAAGIERVVVGRRDPNEQAAGGLATLAEAGVTVVVAEPPAELAAQLAALNRRWEQAVTRQRPVVIWKVAGTLDGRVAAVDGSSRWITGEQARADVHQVRAEVDAVLVGTGTALADDPHLAVRGIPGADQPLRVVMGERQVPATARVFDDAAPTMVLPLHDPRQALAALWNADVRTVLLEGGPTLAAAFLAADLVDELVWYLAPALLGSGQSAVADLGIANIAHIQRWQITELRQLGADLRIDLQRIDLRRDEG